jgi:glycosyltransferase involved in cell wall biosynthesis
MTTEKFMLGVIVPTFNHAKFLKTTLCSLINQSFKDLQIVVIDDCSNDHTQEVLKEFETEPRISVITNRSNLGESESVNIGWKSLQTDYIAIVSADDPQNIDWALGMMNFILLYPGFVGYYPNLQIINDDGLTTKIVKLDNWSAQESKERLLCIASAGSIFNRNFLPRNFLPRTNGVIYPSDLVQIFNMAKYGEFKRVDGILGVWRENTEGMTATMKGVTKAEELHKTISNWLLQNYKSDLELNLNRLKANLYCQMWKLYRRELSQTGSALRLLQYSKISYFLNPANQLHILRAVLENGYFKLRRFT